MPTVLRYLPIVALTIGATLGARSLLASAESSEPTVTTERATEEHRAARVVRYQPRTPEPALLTPASVDSTADETRAIATRIADRITAAEARGTWSRSDAAAVFAELGKLPDDQQRELMARVSAAISQRRMTPTLQFDQ